MRYAMRRFKQLLSPEETRAILERATSGTLALIDADGLPYAVPLSYVFDGATVYFHCAPTGRKIDAVRACGKASFCVIDQDEVHPEKFTTFFRSALACGPIEIVESREEYDRSIRLLSDKYSPDAAEAREREIASSEGRMVMLALRVEDLTGKEAIELVNAKRKAEGHEA